MPIGLARLSSGMQGTVDLPGGPWRALFQWRGEAQLGLGGGTTLVGPETAVPLGTAPCRIEAADPAAHYFLWEVGAPQSLPPLPPSLGERLAHAMPALPEEAGSDASSAALRFERVDLDGGVETPRHTHRGSGLRVMIHGRIDATIGDRALSLLPGDCWLEKGPGEPVIGRVPKGVPSAFVRLLVLPAAAFGEESFVLLEPPADTPRRPATYQRFHEEIVTL